MNNKITFLSICIGCFLSMYTFAGEGPLTPVNLKPNFDENLKSFYVIIGVILALLVTINILAVSIKNVISSVHISQIPHELRKQKIGNLLSSFNKGITVFFIVCMLFYSFATFKLTFTLPGNIEKTPWLQVYKTDLYFFIGMVIILLIMLFFLVNLFNRCMKFIQDSKNIPFVN